MCHGVIGCRDLILILLYTDVLDIKYSGTSINNHPTEGDTYSTGHEQVAQNWRSIHRNFTKLSLFIRQKAKKAKSLTF